MPNPVVMVLERVPGGITHAVVTVAAASRMQKSEYSISRIEASRLEAQTCVPLLEHQQMDCGEAVAYQDIRLLASPSAESAQMHNCCIMARDLVCSACITLLGVVVSYRDTVSVRYCEKKLVLVRRGTCSRDHLGIQLEGPAFRPGVEASGEGVSEG